MELSEFLSIVEICVTILVGYYLSHWVSVRDSQTRALKDYYIEMLKIIRTEVDDFFNSLLAAKLTPKDISSWYGRYQDELTRFDSGLRMSLPIHKRQLAEVINDIHEHITGSDDYNDQYQKNKYNPSAAERVRIAKLRQEVNSSFNEYVVLINNSRQFAWYQILWQRISSDCVYWKQNKKAWWEIFHPWLFSLLGVVIFAFIIGGIYNAYGSYLNNQRAMKNAQNKTQEFQLKMEELLKYNEILIQNENHILNKLNKMDTIVVKVASIDSKMENLQ